MRAFLGVVFGISAGFTGFMTKNLLAGLVGGMLVTGLVAVLFTRKAKE